MVSDETISTENASGPHDVHVFTEDKVTHSIARRHLALARNLSLSVHLRA